MTTTRRIPCAALLFAALLVLLSASITITSAFSPSMPSSSPKGTPPVKKADAPAAGAPPATGAAPAPAVGGVPRQSEYGKSLEMPTTYASCGQCGSTYALTEEAMGPAKGGRRMECSVCSHTWFQSRERIADLGEGFEMIPLPERDMERIQTNMKEGRHPKYMGDFKMYVGNISFQCTEADLFELFETVGPVGDVSMVRDEVGRIRGFGFITMMKKADGEKALEELDGVELKGRNLNVRPSTS